MLTGAPGPPQSPQTCGTLHSARKQPWGNGATAMYLRRMIGGIGFVLAVAVAASSKYGLDTSWFAALGLAVLVFLLFFFVTSWVLAR